MRLSLFTSPIALLLAPAALVAQVAALAALRSGAGEEHPRARQAATLLQALSGVSSSPRR